MEFLNYFDNVFTVYHIALLVGGTFAGIILGALPGLSPTMSVALLIPFTFHMKPESGLILLGAMYTATVAGGAISAILVNVPGAPANIATGAAAQALIDAGADVYLNDKNTFSFYTTQNLVLSVSTSKNGPFLLSITCVSFSSIS